MRARPILPVLVAALLVAPPGRPAAATTGGPRVAARHAILVDADGGAVLWGRASRTARPPASMRRAAFTSPSGRRHTLTARSRFLLGYRGAVGVKTGLTDGAGHCLAAAATRHGRTLIAIVLDSPDTAADAGRMLDWGFGRGRSARMGLRLPGYVAPASVTTLLVRPPRVVERHRPGAPRAVAGASGGGPSPDGRAARGSWRAGARTATGAAVTAALLAAGGLVLRRRRRGMA